MDPLSTALSALRLAWDLYCKYESLSEARETAQNALQPLIRALEDARLGQALQQHSSSGVQGALVDVRKAADKLSERATMIAAKSTWLQVLFATKYTTDLLRLVAKLDSQVSYLRLLVGVDTNLSVQGIQAKQDQTLQQIARLEAALTQQAASTLTSAGTRQQLCVALAEARASGDTAEAATIEKLLAFLAHQPAAASREDAAGLLLQLQRQIGEAQVEKSQAEAELLQQFADYLSVKDTGAAGAGAGAGPARHASADIVPKHLQCVFCYNLYEDPVLLVESGRTFCRKCITQWLEGNNTDPYSNVVLTSRLLAPNRAVCALIEEYKQRRVQHGNEQAQRDVSDQNGHVPPLKASSPDKRATHSHTHQSDTHQVASIARPSFHSDTQSHATLPTPAPVPEGIASHVTMLTDPDPSKQVHALRMLDQLAKVGPTNKTAIVSAGALPHLVHLLSSYVSDVQRWAACTIVDLAHKHPDNAAACAAAGAIPPLVLLLGSHVADVQCNAARALGNLACEHADNCTAIAEAGGMAALVGLLSSSVVTVQDEAAYALGHVAADAACSTVIGRTPGAIPTLVHLLSVSEAQLAACEALARLAHDNAHNQAAIVASKALSPAVKLLSVGNPGVQRLAAKLLGTLAGDPAVRRRLGKKDPAEPLVQLLHSSDVWVQREAARCVGMLALEDTDNQTDFYYAKAVRALVPLLSVGDAHVCSYAAYALRALTSSADRYIQNSCVNKGAIGPLLQLLESGGPDEQYEAANALGNIAQGNPTTQSAVTADPAAVPRLVKLLSSDSSHVPGAGAYALGHLAADHPSNQTIIGAAGAIPQLVCVLDSESAFAQFAAAQAIGRIARDHPSNQSASAGAVVPLVRLLGSTDTRVLGAVLYALGWVVNASPGNQAAAANAGAMPLLIGLLSSADAYVQCATAYAIGALARDQPSTKVAAGAVSALVQLLGSGDKNVRSEASHALKSLGHSHAGEVGGGKQGQKGFLKKLFS